MTEATSFTSPVPTRWLHFVDGEPRPSAGSETLSTEDPATGEPWAEVAAAEAVDVDRAVRAARDAAPAWRAVRPADRARLLIAIAARLREQAAWLGRLDTLDAGRRASKASGQAEEAARIFEYYAGAADKLEGRSIPLGPGYVDYTAREPYGVSGHIVPWNYPITVAARSLAPALATGNTVVLKAPELAPTPLLGLAGALHDAGLPKGVLNVVNGFGSAAGAALVEHPGVDQVVFTGSVETGRQILRAAAERIVPCVVELGGKSAAVVLADADLGSAIDDVAAAVFSHAGQTCSAPTRLLVERSRYDEAVERLARHARGLRVGPGADDAELTPLISEQQRTRVAQACRQAEDSGAQAVVGGRPLDDRPGFFFPATVLVDVKQEMAAVQEEIFGPVITVQPFDDLDEALALANGTGYGLCAGIYTQDLSRAHRAASALVAGQVFVNEWYAGGIETPFGGVGLSGYGREKGLEALGHYTRTKNVAVRLG